MIMTLTSINRKLFNMMRFHSCWHYIFTDYPYLALKDKGFAIQPISDEIINGFKINSVLFQKDNSVQTLQFRELLDEEEFLNFQKRKQARFGSIHNLLRPGVSFLHDSLTEDFILEGLEVFIGTAQSMAALSGVVLEPEKIDNFVNKNLKVVGLFWNLSDNDLDYFCRRTKLKVEDKRIRISEDFNIFLADKNTELYTNFEARKDFPFWGVVVQFENKEQLDSLDQFVEAEYSDEVQVIQWMDQKAILIRHHITHWDMILTTAK